MDKKQGDLATNRKAFHDYEILETFEAGIILLGTEIKSLRAQSAHIQEAYVTINAQQEAFLKNASISPYKFGNIFNHEEKRERKLLLHKRELLKLRKVTQEKGLTLVPLSLYLSKGLVKLKIGVAKGKKLFDKRQSIKEKEQKRTIDRCLKT
ncbi:MAG: SsrA-binding protein SmpB [Rhabdochlamydiaceae bacterium]